MRSLSLSLIVVVVVSIISLGWLLNKIYFSSEQNRTHTSAYQVYLQTCDDLYNTLSNGLLPAEFINQWNRHSQLQLAILPREDFPLPGSLAESFDRGERLILESDQGLAVHYALDQGLEVLAITLPANAVDNQGGKFELLLTLAFYAGLASIMLLWAWPLIHKLLRLRDAAKQLGRGDLEARVNTSGLSYIRDIELEFNRMAERIHSLVKDNKLLTRAVSHDLKTPLARLRFGLDALTETSDEKQRAKYAVRVNRDMEEMEALINTLLQYARLDENRIQVKQEPVDLQQLTGNLIDTYQSDTVQFHYRVSQALYRTDTDRQYLSMLINNLLSNANRYAKGRVDISLDKYADEFVLLIEDDGPGINQEEIAHVSKPFWRGEQGKNRKGHGMGLAIVARIAEWLGASYTISQSKRLGGAAVTVRIPG